MTIEGGEFSAHTILFNAWLDTVSAGMALWEVLCKHANSRSIDAQAALIEEFKDGLGWCLLYGWGSAFEMAVHPPDCLFPGGQPQRG